MSSKTKAAFIVVIAFVAGLFVGVAGDRFVLFRSGQFFHRRGAESATRRLLTHLDRELKLTPEQRTQIDHIMNQHRVRIDAAWSNVRPQMRREIDAANIEIEKMLTPEQQAKFKTMRERSEKGRGRGLF